MKHESPRSKVTVEDLLRIKRAERPSPDFWARFEQELRAKQLAAIVEKQPWWHAWSRGLIRGSRWYLPVGATAALALSVFAVREYHHAAPQASGSTAMAAAVPIPTSMSGAIDVAPASEEMSAHVMASAALTGANLPALEPVAASNVRPGEIARVISMMGADSRSDEASRDSLPTTRLVGANLALNQSLELDSVVSLGNASGFETRGLPAALRSGSETEPLAQMSTPKYRSSARYLTTALPAGYVFETASARPVEPAKNRISDRALREDNVSRLGVDNGGVFWKL